MVASAVKLDPELERMRSQFSRIRKQQTQYLKGVYQYPTI